MQNRTQPEIQFIRTASHGREVQAPKWFFVLSRQESNLEFPPPPAPHLPGLDSRLFIDQALAANGIMMVIKHSKLMPFPGAVEAASLPSEVTGSPWMMTAAMELKDACFLEEKL